MHQYYFVMHKLRQIGMFKRKLLKNNANFLIDTFKNSFSDVGNAEKVQTQVIKKYVSWKKISNFVIAFND